MPLLLKDWSVRSGFNRRKEDMEEPEPSLLEQSNDKEWEFYLECCGHLMDVEFEPGSGLKLKKNSAFNGREEYDHDEIDADEFLFSQGGSESQSQTGTKNKGKESECMNGRVVKGVNANMASTWKSGAITSTLKKLGISLNNSRESSINDPIDMDMYIFDQPNEIRIKHRIGEENNLKRKYVCPVPSWRQNSDNDNDPQFNQQSKKPKLNLYSTNPPATPTSPKPKSNSLFGSISSVPNKISNECPKSKVNSAENNKNVKIEPDNDKQDEESPFQTAKSLLVKRDLKKGIKRNFETNSDNQGPGKRTNSNNNNSKLPVHAPNDSEESPPENPELEELMAHKEIKVFEKGIVEAILNEVMEHHNGTQFDDIAGLRGPKKIIEEVIIWPMKRPDLFKGLRASPKGILLFGPPGTGKTMIGRLIATQSKSTFFNISASSLTSKWIGDGEKLVRCLFQVARIKQPSVIFIDEIDSILTQRSDTEHESSRRLKTEFLIQFDGCGTNSEDRVLVIGVTNRPQELDEAARRRLVKRVYIPLPDFEGRRIMIENLMKDQIHNISEDDIVRITKMSEGYSGADMRSLCQEASYGPIRDIGHMLEDIDVDKVRPIKLKDFVYALKRVKSSVSIKDLVIYEDWDREFGCHTQSPDDDLDD